MSILLRSLAAAFLFAVAATGTLAEETVTVFAAASLQDALKDEAKAFTAKTGIAVKYSFDSSSTLARQIEQHCGKEAVRFHVDFHWFGLDSVGIWVATLDWMRSERFFIVCSWTSGWVHETGARAG